MYWHCEICDNIMIEQLKNKHLEFKFHKLFVNSIIGKNNKSKPLPDKIEDKK